jgi:hypothetical protein
MLFCRLCEHDVSGRIHSRLRIVHISSISQWPITIQPALAHAMMLCGTYGEALLDVM